MTSRPPGYNACNSRDARRERAADAAISSLLATTATSKERRREYLEDLIITSYTPGPVNPEKDVLGDKLIEALTQAPAYALRALVDYWMICERVVKKMDEEAIAVDCCPATESAARAGIALLLNALQEMDDYMVSERTEELLGR